jgi:hypothetical protein
MRGSHLWVKRCSSDYQGAVASKFLEVAPRFTNKEDHEKGEREKVEVIEAYRVREREIDPGLCL